VIKNPIKFCEEKLKSEKEYNLQHNILPIENEIIDRLLIRRTEMANVYLEICEKLATVSSGVWIFLRLIPSLAAIWNPERIAKQRVARTRLETINPEIGQCAEQLTRLLLERNEIYNKSGFSADTHYHIVDVIDVAASGNGHYRSFLKPKLDSLASQYDLKYWPTLPDLVRVIGQDAQIAEISATDPLTQAATTGPRASRADFFKALFAHVDHNIEAGHLPPDFKLSDNALASIANCALDLGPNDLVDAAYVKRLRQRERKSPNPTRR